MTVYLCAIDGGSQSTKVSIIDASGAVHASAQVPLRPYELGPGGRAVHPDDDLWDTLTQACRAVLASFDGDPRDIVAVGLCGIRFCRALVGADGRLVEPVQSWMDERVSRPLGDVDDAVTTVCSAGGYLAVRLTGARRDSAASYQGMWPIDHERQRWSTRPEELARTGMPLSLLPELVEPGGLLGRVSEEAADQTGLASGVPVHATANDKAVEALGAGLLAPGTLVLSLGTYVTSMTVADAPAGADDRYWLNAAAVPGRQLVESAGVRRGMWTVSWLRQLVSSAAPDLVDPDDVEEWLDAGARDVPAGCAGLMTLPDWLAPADAPSRRGAFLGLDGSHGPHHLHRSIIEGIVLTMCDHAEAMETALGHRAPRLVVAGGGARSNLVMQIVSDVFDRPAQRSAVPDAAGLGAAICAAVGAGVHRDVETAVEAMMRPGDVFGPDPDARRRYREVRQVYRGLRERTDPLHHAIATLS
ncbi:FGGY-family carbohydrate kinase [Aeromicrobium sp. CTD01-1L150]|uniref:FGGY-family carbohydrate kinase n=1 Tax=Aeromicrobium sp. CTD01-1L150 TaxID=3341830 RepID=UPI0035BF9BD3